MESLNVLFSRISASPVAWLLLWALTLLAYAGALPAGFVWDDFPVAVDNPLTQSFDQAGKWFTSDLWGGLGESGYDSGFYRPLVLASFTVDQVVFAGHPTGAHAQSIL